MTPQATATIEPDILDFFAGPGGWDRGDEVAGINTQRIKGIELDTAAVATARAAGHNRVYCNVLDLNPKDFLGIRGLIASAPWPDLLGRRQAHRPLGRLPACPGHHHAPRRQARL